jgi:hypothetical protein
VNPATRAVLKKVFGPAKRKCEADVFWIRRRIIFALDLDRASRAAAKIPVAFRFGSAAELDGLTREEHDYDEPSRAFGHRRLAAGDKLALGVHQGTVVFYAWLMFNQLDLNCEQLIPTSSERAYSYKVFTCRAYRGLGICPAYYAHLACLLRQQGYAQLLCHVLSTNAASLRAHTSAGFIPAGSFWEFQIGGRLCYFLPRRLRSRVETPTNTFVHPHGRSTGSKGSSARG